MTKIYVHPNCPYAQRVIIAYHEMGIKPRDISLEYIDFSNSPAALEKITPDWTVPMIEFQEGVGFDCSMQIIKYLDANHRPNGSIFPQDKLKKELIIFKQRQLVNYFLYPLKRLNYTQEDHPLRSNFLKQFAFGLDFFENLLRAQPELQTDGQRPLNFIDYTLVTFLNQRVALDKKGHSKLLPTGSLIQEYTNTLLLHKSVKPYLPPEDLVVKILKSMARDNQDKPEVSDFPHVRFD